MDKINKGNLLDMLTPGASVPEPQKPALSVAEVSPLSQPSPKKPQSAEEQICVKLPANFIEYIRDFQYHEAVKSGNVYFSFKDAIASIITSHQNQNPVVTPRPDVVKASEKKTGRKKG